MQYTTEQVINQNIYHLFNGADSITIGSILVKRDDHIDFKITPGLKIILSSNDERGMSFEYPDGTKVWRTDRNVIFVAHGDNRAQVVVVRGHVVALSKDHERLCLTDVYENGVRIVTQQGDEKSLHTDDKMAGIEFGDYKILACPEQNIITFISRDWPIPILTTAPGRSLISLDDNVVVQSDSLVARTP